jgi:hypothetical protein
MGAQHKVAKTGFLQAAQDGTSDQPAVARDEDGCGLIHGHVSSTTTPNGVDCFVIAATTALRFRGFESLFAVTGKATSSQNRHFIFVIARAALPFVIARAAGPWRSMRRRGLAPPHARAPAGRHKGMDCHAARHGCFAPSRLRLLRGSQ